VDNTPNKNAPALVTLAEAVGPYHGVTIRMLQAWIRNGRLASVRAGKGYLIDPKELAALLQPKLREPAPPRKRESEAARAARQLAAAGVG
jgi:hypothetical protein